MVSSRTIRKAVVSDFDDLNILMASLGYEIEGVAVPKRRNVFESILKNEHQEILVVEAKNEKKIHAMISYTVVPQLRLSGLKMEIDELVVSPEARGEGFGGELVNYVISKAKEISVKRIFISSNKQRESYQRDFYKKLGFNEKNSAFFELNVSV